MGMDDVTTQKIIEIAESQCNPYICGVIGALMGISLLGITIAVGFTVEGVLANSLAAAIQSMIGNVARGSIFAWLMSFGATMSILRYAEFALFGALISIAICAKTCWNLCIPYGVIAMAM